MGVGDAVVSTDSVALVSLWEVPTMYFSAHHTMVGLIAHTKLFYCLNITCCLVFSLLSVSFLVQMCVHSASLFCSCLFYNWYLDC
jgi:hypothetical protein